MISLVSNAMLYTVFSSVVGFFLVKLLIPRCAPAFIKRNLFGRDMAKKSKPIIAESLGVVCASVYLLIMVSSIIPICSLFDVSLNSTSTEYKFSVNDQYVFIYFITALLSICTMTFLGFADDVFDLRWRYKFPLPAFASLPLLMVYYVTSNVTFIVLPHPLRFITGRALNIGFLYYIYMGSLTIFCTNAINILSGINGVEVGQSVVIAFSIAVFNVVEILTEGEILIGHILSLHLIVPFIGCSLALLMFNWCPAKVFIGDTFCYFAGMLFAVIVPQLFHWLPCPRHRLPKYDPETDKVGPSYTDDFLLCKLSFLGRLSYEIATRFHLVSVQKSVKDGSTWVRISNLTIINVMLRITGPLHESHTTSAILVIQFLFSCLAFLIRYPIRMYFYN